VTYNATGSTNVSGGLNWTFSSNTNPTTSIGNGPFTITYVNSGNYLAILTGYDQFGCEATEFVNVQVTAAPVLINPATQTICSNNSTNITLMNNIPTGTSVQWSVSSNPFVSGASAGSGNVINQTLTNNSSQFQTITYTITATKGSCTVVSTVIVTINPGIIPTFNVVNPACPGGNLSALPNTSLNGISGTWSPALNNQAPTTYTFTPTAGQCASPVTMTVVVSAAPIISNVVTNETCTTANNGIIAVTASGVNNGYNVSWTGTSTGNPVGTEIANSGGTYSITNLNAGSYTITVSNTAECSSTATAIVTEPLPLVATISAPPILCPGSATVITVGATGGIGPYTGTGTYTVTAGTYTYTVTDANGCTSTVTITITDPAPIALPAITHN
jgi:hypothetical protein